MMVPIYPVPNSRSRTVLALVPVLLMAACSSDRLIAAAQSFCLQTCCMSWYVTMCTNISFCSHITYMHDVWAKAMIRLVQWHGMENEK